MRIITPSSSRTHGRTGLGFAVGLFAAAVVVALAVKPDGMVEASFDRALTGRLDAPHASALASTGLARARTGIGPEVGPLVGDERFWLTRADHQSPLAPRKLLAVGDRISIQSAIGVRAIEIVDVTTLAPALMPVGFAQPGHDLLVITGKAANTPDAALVRFIVDATTLLPAEQVGQTLKLGPRGEAL